MLCMRCIKKIMLITSLGCSFCALSAFADKPLQPKNTAAPSIQTDEITAQSQKAGQMLQGINRILGMNGVTTNVQLQSIVDVLEKARGLLMEGEEHIPQAVDLLIKAQDLPGSKTLVAPGVYDSFGHPTQFSMWRMLALVRNGKDPLATR